MSRSEINTYRFAPRFARGFCIRAAVCDDARTAGEACAVLQAMLAEGYLNQATGNHRCIPDGNNPACLLATQYIQTRTRYPVGQIGAERKCFHGLEKAGFWKKEQAPGVRVWVFGVGRTENPGHIVLLAQDPCRHVCCSRSFGRQFEFRRVSARILCLCPGD